MDEKRIEVEKIMDELDELTKKYGTETFTIAVYIYMRFGKFDFKYYIDNTDLEEMAKEIVKADTIFNSDLNDTTMEIYVEDDEEN